jgi:hypothetical protein
MVLQCQMVQLGPAFSAVSASAVEESHLMASFLYAFSPHGVTFCIEELHVLYQVYGK